MASSLAAITSSGLSGRPSFTMDAIADCRLLSIECSATGKEGVGGWVFGKTPGGCRIGRAEAGRWGERTVCFDLLLRRHGDVRVNEVRMVAVTFSRERLTNNGPTTFCRSITAWVYPTDTRVSKPVPTSRFLHVPTRAV
eukprot:scaffold10820_cov54-Phaeocystis_antarctica.AAC.3